MKWLKKVAATPLTSIAKVIDSLDISTNARTNAPSIKAVADMKTNVESALADLQAQISASAAQIYPVGAIYISVNDTNPSSIFGGTWEKVEDRFLLASGSTYINGATGGAATHTLTESEMPNHGHDYYRAESVTDAHVLTIDEIPAHTHDVTINCKTTYGAQGTGAQTSKCSPTLTETYTSTSTGGTQGHTHTISDASWRTADVGGGSAHNNMPPYLVVNMWVRVS